MKLSLWSDEQYNEIVNKLSNEEEKNLDKFLELEHILGATSWDNRPLFNHAVIIHNQCTISYDMWCELVKSGFILIDEIGKIKIDDELAWRGHHVEALNRIKESGVNMIKGYIMPTDDGFVTTEPLCPLLIKTPSAT